MKVSEFLREYKESGQLPDTPMEDGMVAFWAGWLLGAARGRTENAVSMNEAFNSAIHAAEFIEEHAK